MGGTIKLWKFWFSRLPSCGQNIWRWSRCGNREPPERSSCREKRTLSDKHFYVWQKSSSANIFTLCYLSENISIIVFWKQRPSAKNTEIPFMSASVYGGTKTHFSFHQTLHSVPSCLNPIYQQGKNQSSSEDEIGGGRGWQGQNMVDFFNLNLDTMLWSSFLNNSNQKIRKQNRSSV